MDQSISVVMQSRTTSEVGAIGPAEKVAVKVGGWDERDLRFENGEEGRCQERLVMVVVVSVG